MAANFKINDPIVGAPLPVTATATYATNNIPFPLGLVVKAYDRNSGSDNLGGGVFQYVVGSDVGSAGQFVQLQGNTALLLNELNTASKFPIGVAAGPLSASNVYGWVQIAGMCDYATCTNSSLAAGVPLYVHTDSDAPGYLVVREGTEIVHLGHMVCGVVLPVAMSSSATNNMTVQLIYPEVLGLTASI